MTYEEARNYIEHASKTGMSLGLSRMRELCRRLGNPQDKLSFIHIAGTNGKGSTAAYISSILGCGGYLVGRYVSPVVFQYEECIQYQDMEGIHYIDRELLARLVTQVAAAAEEMAAEGEESPTVFEIETAVSFLAFCHWQCQVVVLEVGLGGGQDATNVIENVVASVITPISMDHMHILGNTLTEIAREKAGIIRGGGNVVSYQPEQEAAQVIATVCEEKGAKAITVKDEDIRLLKMDLSGSVFSYQGEHFRTEMSGRYQIENACLAIEACRHLGESFSMEEEQLVLGIRQAYWRGRFEVVCPEPLILIDGAHNESGIRALRTSIQELLPGRCIHGVMGVFRDKDYEKMVKMILPIMRDVVTVTAPGPRGLPAEELAEVWRNFGCEQVETAESVMAGLKKAMGQCHKDDAIVIFGSLSLLSQLKWR